MINPSKIESAIAKVKDQHSFIKELLSGALGWPVDESAEYLDDISFGLTEAELNAEGLSKHIVDGRVFQIQRLSKKQPWGVFILEFKNQDIVSSGRGMTAPLRKLLNRLVSNRRKDPSIPSWKRENLLFICTHSYTHYRWAFFKAPKDSSKNSPLTTFGWSPDSPARTACEFNLPPLEWPDDENNTDKWIALWSSAFDVEAVTKQFFTVYRTVFEEVESSITGFGKDTERKRLFTQRLFNRLMFVAFIQKKGWLSFADNKNYLKALWDDYSKNKEDGFYSSRLYHLFFLGLSTSTEVDIIGKNRGGVLKDIIGAVPYLNGGLFEQDDDDRNTSIKIPDKCFQKILDELINRWNFTVTENTPLDIEVAVDPEMLGKVFEELVTGRHESGSYYTPKPVVSFMCREALKGYLKTALPSESEKALAHFVDGHDPEGLKNPETALTALRNVKVLDPACGSGAYLVGMLHELLDLRHTLFVVKKLDSQTVYDRKLEIIENNLYGVDLDPFAVNIARLRLWLSLAVDFEKKDKNDEVPPLPNLDFKIEVGDSLTAPNLEAELKKNASLFFTPVIQRFAEKKADYMVSHHGMKQTLKQDIAKIKEEIRALVGHTSGAGFDWSVEFAEVFLPRSRVKTTLDGSFGFVNEAQKQQSMTEESGGSPGGFDIVVANPPYIRHELIKEAKPALKSAYPTLFAGTADLYCYFYIRALELLCPGGMLSFISSNKWFRAGYGEKLRAHIANTCAIHSITDFGDLPVFIGATAYPMIFIARKGKDDKITPMFTQVKSLDPPYPDIPAVIKEAGYKLPKEAITGAEWRLADAETITRLKKMESAGVPLGEYVKGEIYYGIKTGFNEAFVIDGEKRAELIAEDSKSAEVIKPLAVGRDIKKWRVEDNGKWLIFTRRGIAIDKYPAIKKHLSQWKKDLTPKKPSDGKDVPGRKPGSYKWYEIQDDIAYYEEFEKPKIVWGNLGLEPKFSFSKKALYVMAPANIIPCDDLFLLGLLNSQTSKRFFDDISIQRGGDYLEFKPVYVKQFLVPHASAHDRAAIEALVRKCLDAKGEGCEAWEREIDEIVARLYGL